MSVETDLRKRLDAAEAKLAAVRDWATTSHGGIKTPAEVWPGLAAILGVDGEAVTEHE